MRTLLIYAASWMGLMLLAIINGAIRESWYGSFMSALAAHQISTVIGLLLFSLYLWVLTGVCKLTSSSQAWQVGGLWLVMTLCFEFLFGHYVMHHSWQILLHDYDILSGRVWVLVLLWTLMAPYVCFRIRQ